MRQRLEECPYLEVLELTLIKLPTVYPAFSVPRENSDAYFAWFDRVSVQTVLFDVNPEYSQFAQEYLKEQRQAYRRKYRRFGCVMTYKLRLMGASLYSSGNWDPHLLLTPQAEMTTETVQHVAWEFSRAVQVAPFWRCLMSWWRKLWGGPALLVGRSVRGLEFYLALDAQGKVIPAKYDLVNLIQSQQEYHQLASQVNSEVLLEDPVYEGTTSAEADYQVLLRCREDKAISSVQTVGEILYINLTPGPNLAVPCHIPLTVRRLLVVG